jgi:hypothetical protein
MNLRRDILLSISDTPFSVRLAPDASQRTVEPVAEASAKKLILVVYRRFIRGL